MHVRFPKGFQDILDYLSVFKGDLLNYLNLKCAVQLNLYSGFAFTMTIPVISMVVCLLAKQFQDRRAHHDEPAGQNEEATRKKGLLNQMFAVLFCVPAPELISVNNLARNGPILCRLFFENLMHTRYIRFYRLRSATCSNVSHSDQAVPLLTWKNGSSITWKLTAQTAPTNLCKQWLYSSLGSTQSVCMRRQNQVVLLDRIYHIVTRG